MPATKAYGEAGYSTKGKNAEANAARLSENEGVIAKIAEYRKLQTAKVLHTKEDNLRILLSIINAPIGDIDQNSPIAKAFGYFQVSGGNRGNLKRGTEESGKPVFQSCIKIADKLKAIDLFSKPMGDHAIRLREQLLNRGNWCTLQVSNLRKEKHPLKTSDLYYFQGL
ncbi:terminase small subunit [bacterium]|nr:terminase small subunit [bacterium]